MGKKRIAVYEVTMTAYKQVEVPPDQEVDEPTNKEIEEFLERNFSFPNLDFSFEVKRNDK